ncbi:uncharacterized protein LOC144950372 [Lampetra fluviatilis]
MRSGVAPGHPFGTRDTKVALGPHGLPFVDGSGSWGEGDAVNAPRSGSSSSGSSSGSEIVQSEHRSRSRQRAGSRSQHPCSSQSDESPSPTPPDVPRGGRRCSDGAGTGAEPGGDAAAPPFLAERWAEMAAADEHTDTRPSSGNLLQLLSVLEGEIQARDEVIALLRAEHVSPARLEARYGTAAGAGALRSLQRDAALGDGDPETRRHRDSDDVYETPMAELDRVIARQRETHARALRQLLLAQSSERRSARQLEAERHKHGQYMAQSDDFTNLLELERERLKRLLDQEKASIAKREKQQEAAAATLQDELRKLKSFSLLLVDERQAREARLEQQAERLAELSARLGEEQARAASQAERASAEAEGARRSAEEAEERGREAERARREAEALAAEAERRACEQERLRADVERLAVESAELRAAKAELEEALLSGSQEMEGLRRRAVELEWKDGEVREAEERSAELRGRLLAEGGLLAELREEQRRLRARAAELERTGASELKQSRDECRLLAERLHAEQDGARALAADVAELRRRLLEAERSGEELGAAETALRGEVARARALASALAEDRRASQERLRLAEASVEALAAELTAERDRLSEASGRLIEERRRAMHERAEAGEALRRSREECDAAHGSLNVEREKAREAAARAASLREQLERATGTGGGSDGAIEGADDGTEPVRPLVNGWPNREAAVAAAAWDEKARGPHTPSPNRRRDKKRPPAPQDRVEGHEEHAASLAEEVVSLRREVATFRASQARPAPAGGPEERPMLWRRCEAAEARVRDLESDLEDLGRELECYRHYSRSMLRPLLGPAGRKLVSHASLSDACAQTEAEPGPEGPPEEASEAATVAAEEDRMTRRLMMMTAAAEMVARSSPASAMASVEPGVGRSWLPAPWLRQGGGDAEATAATGAAVGGGVCGAVGNSSATNHSSSTSTSRGGSSSNNITAKCNNSADKSNSNSNSTIRSSNSTVSGNSTSSTTSKSKGTSSTVSSNSASSTTSISATRSSNIIGRSNTSSIISRSSMSSSTSRILSSSSSSSKGDGKRMGPVYSAMRRVASVMDVSRASLERPLQIVLEKRDVQAALASLPGGDGARPARPDAATQNGTDGPKRPSATTAQDRGVGAARRGEGSPRGAGGSPALPVQRHAPAGAAPHPPAPPGREVVSAPSTPRRALSPQAVVERPGRRPHAERPRSLAVVPSCAGRIFNGAPSPPPVSPPAFATLPRSRARTMEGGGGGDGGGGGGNVAAAASLESRSLATSPVSAAASAISIATTATLRRTISARGGRADVPPTPPVNGTPTAAAATAAAAKVAATAAEETRIQLQVGPQYRRRAAGQGCDGAADCAPVDGNVCGTTSTPSVETDGSTCRPCPTRIPMPRGSKVPRPLSAIVSFIAPTIVSESAVARGGPAGGGGKGRQQAAVGGAREA